MKIKKIKNKNESVIPGISEYCAALEALKDEMSLKQRPKIAEALHKVKL